MEERYSIGQLQELTGVSRRAIRFYIARDLLDPPLGAGRGHYYTARHLQQLRQIHEFRRQGFGLDEIRRLRKEAELGPGRVVPPAQQAAVEARLGVMRSVSLDSREDPARFRKLKAPSTERGRPFPEPWLRVPLKPGVELHLQKQIAGLTETDIEGLIKLALQYITARTVT